MTLLESIKFFYDKRRYNRDKLKGVILKEGRGINCTPYCPYSPNCLVEIIARLLSN